MSIKAALQAVRVITGSKLPVLVQRGAKKQALPLSLIGRSSGKMRDSPTIITKKPLTGSGFF
jgi:hypothetical protein